MRLTPADVLERAADRIDRDGWRPEGGRGKGWCALQAITGRKTKWDERADSLMDAIAPLALAVDGPSESESFFVIDLVDRVWNWNDARGRTQAEVSAMLRAVAASLRAAGTPAGESTVADSPTEHAGQMEESCI
jgi:hypothetical protein